MPAQHGQRGVLPGRVALGHVDGAVRRLLGRLLGTLLGKKTHEEGMPRQYRAISATCTHTAPHLSLGRSHVALEAQAQVVSCFHQVLGGADQHLVHGPCCWPRGPHDGVSLWARGMH